MTADPAPPGPFRTLALADGTDVPWYMLRFDRKGRSESPDEQAALVADLGSGGYSDVYLFCHGWNNSWDDAVRTYEAFVAGYAGLRRDLDLALGRPYRPLLVGISWPSAILVTSEEAGPGLVAADAAIADAIDEADRRAVEELASELADEDAERLRRLASRETLEPKEARELAVLLGPVYGEQDDYEPLTAPGPDELVQLWSGGPGLAGILVRLRDAVRQATVWLMKDRAGRVGSAGLGPLVAQSLEAAPDSRLHLVGHSFGCRALLAAVCAEPLPRQVDSVLLLQAAINHRCFAVDATGDGRPGGFRPALDRVRQPVLATYSDKDASLRRFFHLALRRESDVGETQLVTAAPSLYAALGGYGPDGCGPECELITMPAVGQRYPAGGPHLRLYGVDGSAAISGHGDISNPATWWALWCQVSAA